MKDIDTIDIILPADVEADERAAKLKHMTERKLTDEEIEFGRLMDSACETDSSN